MTPEEFRKLPIIKRVNVVSKRLASGDSRDLIKKELGINRYELSHLRRLDKHLAHSSRSLIDKNGLSEGHARALARVRGVDQDRLLRDTIQKRWSVRVLEQAVKAHLDGVEFADRSSDAEYYAQLAEFIADQIGHPVRILPAKEPGTGQITITYFDLDAFDGILKRMRVKLPDDI